MKRTLTIILTLLVLSVFGQKSAKKIIFFESGKSSVSYTNKLRIDSLLSKNKDMEVTLIGHADSIGSEKINKRISQKRAQSVANYLSKKGVNTSNISVKSSGEIDPLFSNRTAAGRKKNRCVEIIFKLKGIEAAPIAATPAPPAEKKVFENDTIIYGKRGTLIIVKAETFFPKKIKDIDFEITEVFTMCDMLKNNMMTRTNNGDCLTSAGMLQVRPTIAGQTILPNQGKAILVKVPTLNGKAIDKSMKLYGGVKNKNGEIVWKNIESEVTYEENGNQYYVFKMDTIMSVNLDKPIGILCQKTGHKIKVPKFKFTTVCQTYPDEKYLSVGEKITDKKFRLDKTDDAKKPVITIMGFDENNTPFIATGPLNELKYKKRRDMYIVKKKYFKRLYETKPDMKANDYLCEYLDK